MAWNQAQGAVVGSRRAAAYISRLLSLKQKGRLRNTGCPRTFLEVLSKGGGGCNTGPWPVEGVKQLDQNLVPTRGVEHNEGCGTFPNAVVLGRGWCPCVCVVGRTLAPRRGHSVGEARHTNNTCARVRL